MSRRRPDPTADYHSDDSSALSDSTASSRLDGDAVEQWSKEDMDGTLDGPSGALRAATTKAWNQWKAKLRKSLKGTRSQEWTAARRACASLVREGKPQDRWANWHVLAGEHHDRWRQEWLEEECGLAAQVWCFSPDQEGTNR